MPHHQMTPARRQIQTLSPRANFLKSTSYIVTFHSQYTRALTFSEISKPQLHAARKLPQEKTQKHRYLQALPDLWTLAACVARVACVLVGRELCLVEAQRHVTRLNLRGKWHEFKSHELQCPMRLRDAGEEEEEEERLRGAAGRC
jgi:hypothetical protein